MKTVWYVEDEVDLGEVFSEIISDMVDLTKYEIKVVSHFDFLQAEKGDIVFHDIHGVGEPKFIEGVAYFCVSGDYEKDGDVDLQKPYDFKEVERLITKECA